MSEISDERSDVELLLAHVAGHAAAFAVLFTRHRDRLWAVALRTMGNPEEAADGLQDGLIAAYRRARLALRAGTPIPFPQGTYWLRRFLCVEIERCEKIS